MYLFILQSEAATLKEQVKCLSEDNVTLKQALERAEAATEKHKNDYKDSQVSWQIAKWLMSEYRMCRNVHEFLVILFSCSPCL